MNTTLKNTGMKRCAFVLMCLMLSTPVRADEEGYRSFSDTQGRTFKGRLMEYDAVSESVTLKRSDGKTGRMQLARFSDTDRLFILDWGASRRFQEGLEFMPTLSSTAVSKQESGISDATKKVFDSVYKIRLMNRTNAPFEKIHFEYCIFYNQGERKGRTVRYEEGSCYGKGIVEMLRPSSELVGETKSIRLYTVENRSGTFGNDAKSLANVHGIWLRLKTKLPSGREMMREYRTSEDIEWKWAPYSFGAGQNEGEHEQTFHYVK